MQNINNNRDRRKKEPPRLCGGEEIRLDGCFDELERRKGAKRRLCRIGAVVLLFFALCAFVVLIYPSKKTPQKANTDKQDEQARLGAFESEETLEACRRMAVNVRVGTGRCGGVIYSSDGWICTLRGIVNERICEQIRVELFDGREYGVECFWQDRESGVTLLKISESALEGIAVDRDNSRCAQTGERIYVFSSLEADGTGLFSGEVTQDSVFTDIDLGDGKPRVLSVVGAEILLDNSGAGAAVFGEDGGFLGLACAKSADGSDMIRYIYPAESLKQAINTRKQCENNREMP